MVDAAKGMRFLGRFLCVFTGDLKTDPKLEGGVRGGVKAEGSVGAYWGGRPSGLFHPGLSSEQLAIRFYYGLEKLAPMYTDIEPMMTSRLTTRIDFIPYLWLVNFNYGVIYDVMGRT